MADQFVNLDSELVGLQVAIAQAMRTKAPSRTGNLRRSIKPQKLIDTPQGIQAPITYINYGQFPDFGTKYQKAQEFTERSQEQELRKQANAIGMAAGEDVLNILDLPTEIDLTLQVKI